MPCWVFKGWIHGAVTRNLKREYFVCCRVVGLDKLSWEVWDKNLFWGWGVLPLDGIDGISFFCLLRQLCFMIIKPYILLWKFHAWDHEMMSMKPSIHLGYRGAGVGGGCFSVWMTSSEGGSLMNRPFEGGFEATSGMSWLFIAACDLWLNPVNVYSVHPPEKERLLIFINPPSTLWERDY